MTSKENMTNSFCTVTNTTGKPPFPTFLFQVHCHLKFIVNHLPKEKLDFQWHLTPPDVTGNPAGSTSISQKPVK
jgi:hypothetical protein